MNRVRFGSIVLAAALSLAGIADGEHVRSSIQLDASAKDNQGQKVGHIELRVDDLVVAKADADKVAFAWDTTKLAEGPHTVDVVAKNAKGQESRRRVEVYAGNVFMTQVGTRFVDNGTQVTLRNIADDGQKGAVNVRIYPDEGTDAQKKEPVFTSKLDSRHGPMAFFFSGKDGKGNVLVTHNGRTGLFTPSGAWIEGDIFEADPHLCGWVGGPKMAHHRIAHNKS